MAKINPIATVLASALTGSYAALVADTVFLTQPARLVVFTNDCDVPLLLSFDKGVSTHMRLPAGVSVTLDLYATGVEISDGIYVKHDGAAGVNGKLSATVVMN